MRQSLCALVGLAFCAFLLSGPACPAQNRGHWALKERKILIDGDRSNGSDTGVSSVSDGRLEFNIVHSIPQMISRGSSGTGSVTADGRSFSTQNSKEYTKEIYDWNQEQIEKSGDGTIRVDIGGHVERAHDNMHRLSLTWTPPQQYVEVGKENEIFVSFNARYDDKPFDIKAVREDAMMGLTESFEYSLGVAVMPGIKTDRYALNYNTVSRILANSSGAEEFSEDFNDAFGDFEDEIEEAFEEYDGDQEWDESVRDVASAKLAFDDDSWNQCLQLEDDAFMVVQFTLEYHRSNQVQRSTHTITALYLYQCFPDGGDFEVIRPAEEPPGEDKGLQLPPWVIPAAVSLGLLGLIGKVIQTVTDKVKKNKEDKGQDKSEKKKEAKKPSTYKMYIYKEFGNKLIVGDPPKIIGARIEEITAEGKRIERKDLTAKIEITEVDNIKILALGMSPRYRTASIQVPDPPQNDVWQGTIAFTFRTSHGALIQKVVFEIEDGRVIFFQPNLTLPSNHKDEERLPFQIIGVSEEAEVEATIDKAYTVSLERAEKPGFWYAVINEKDKKVGKAGEYTIHTLHVKATDTNQHEVTGELPVLRFNMGLVFKTDPFVGCYIERYDPARHPRDLKIMNNGKAYAPCVTTATLSFIYWDEEKHELTRMVPDPRETMFYAEPLAGERDAEFTDYASRETKGMSDQQVIDKIKIQMLIKEVLGDNSTNCIVYPGALLDPPARRKVNLHVEFFWDKEFYKADQEVWFTSQPLRENGLDPVTGESDDAITNNLIHIKDYILRHDLLQNIGPVYRLCEMLLDGYDYRFGYDPGLAWLARNTFLNFVSGKIAGANAEAEPVEEMGFAADLMVALAKTSVQAEQWLEDHGGFWTRMSLGILTLGWSETALTAIKIPKDMLDVVNDPVNPGGAWKAFFVGVKTVAIEFATEQLWGAALQNSAEFIAHYHPEFAANCAAFASKAIGDVKDSLGILGKDVREIGRDLKNFASERFGRNTIKQLNQTKQLQKNLKKSTEEIIREYRQNSKWTPEEILEDELGRQANINGLKKVKEFEHSYLEYRRYRTPEAEAAFKKLAYEIQADKVAQKQLALYNGTYSYNLRSEYYRTLQADYRIVDQKTIKKITEKMRDMGENIDEEDLIIHCATNSNKDALESGIDLTRDRDVTVLRRKKPTKANPDPIPEEIPQDIAEDAYNEAYKETTGLTAAEGDQAVVQKGSDEMIGAGEDDLRRGFQKEHFGEDFTDVDGVANAFKHKPAAWIDAGLQLERAGDTAAGLAKQEEGLRQAYKLYFNSIEPRGTYRGTLGKLTDTEKEMFYLIKQIEVKTQDSFSLSVTDVKKIIKERYNMEITDIPKKLEEMVYRLES